jgi:crossover junction endodeoxyribonuclease RusA
VRLSLPYPPSVNRIWRVFRNRIIKSAEGRAYSARVQTTVALLGLRPLDGPVSVTVAAYRPARRGDLDNVLKAGLDALNGVAWGDDSQVVELHAVRFDDKASPRLEVTVCAAGEVTRCPACGGVARP